MNFLNGAANDIYVKIPVTVAEATLGAKIEVPTIDGRSLVRIPPATNSGKTLRLKEKGVPGARNGARGDQYAEIQVVVPQPTDERVRNLMKELETLAPDDPREDIVCEGGRVRSQIAGREGTKHASRDEKGQAGT